MTDRALRASPPAAAWPLHYLLYATYLAVALTLVARGAFESQDYATHMKFVRALLGEATPWTLKVETNPPLLFALAARFVRVEGEARGMRYLAIFFALLNGVSLHLWWVCARRLLSRGSALLTLALVATLPAFVATSVVFAADALVFFPLLLLCYLNLRLLEAGSSPPAPLLLASGIVQVLGGVTKYSFVSMVPATFLFWGFLCYRNRYLPRTALAVLLLTSAIPSAANLYVLKRSHGASPHVITFPRLAGEMTLRSLAFPYGRDRDLLGAPLYFQPITRGGQQVLVDPDGNPNPRGHPGYEILVRNRYSYPALLNLGLHTDVMNVARRRLQGDNSFTRYGPVSPVNQLMQRASFATGTLFTLAAILAVPALLYAGLRARRPPPAARPGDGSPDVGGFVFAVLLPALCFYGLIAGMFPFMGGEVYYAGYWLPRLVMPALLVFAIAAAWALAPLARWRPLAWALCGLVAIKVGLQLGLLLA